MTVARVLFLVGWTAIGLAYAWVVFPGDGDDDRRGDGPGRAPVEPPPGLELRAPGAVNRVAQRLGRAL